MNKLIVIFIYFLELRGEQEFEHGYKGQAILNLSEKEAIAEIKRVRKKYQQENKIPIKRFILTVVDPTTPEMSHAAELRIRQACSFKEPETEKELMETEMLIHETYYNDGSIEGRNFS